MTGEGTTVRSLRTAMKTQQQCCNAAMKTQHNQKRIFLMDKNNQVPHSGEVDYPNTQSDCRLMSTRTPVETQEGILHHTEQRGTRVLRLQSQAPLVLPTVSWRPSLAGQAATLELLYRTHGAAEVRSEEGSTSGPSIKLRPVNTFPRAFTSRRFQLWQTQDT